MMPNGSGHPLNFLRVLADSPSLEVRRLPRILLFLFKTLFDSPWATLEWMRRTREIEETEIHRPPVFILGYDRSGTTLLHKLMASDPQWAAPRMMDLLFPYWSPAINRAIQPMVQTLIRWLRIKNPTFNEYPLDLDDPVEDGIYSLYHGCLFSGHWGEVLPKRANDFRRRLTDFPDEAMRERWESAFLYFLRKTLWRTGGGRLLVKDPLHTARIPVLLGAFPAAQFVFLHRSPYEVFFSKRSLCFRNSRAFGLQRVRDEEVEEFIFQDYRRVMGAFERDRPLIPPGQLHEAPYVQLREDPLGTVQGIYRSLDIPGWSEARTPVASRVEKERNYRPSTYHYDEEMLERIEEEWGRFIHRWGYRRPF